MFITFQMSSEKSKSKFYLSCGKRIFDLILTLTTLILLSPVFIIATLLVRVQLGRPVLFKQIRPGLHEKPFTIFKFRTMSEARDNTGKLLPDAERLTCLGAFLRKTSVDELPGLFNVLKGDMSIVGPRPLLMAYLPYYTNRERLRHTVRPGITGLSQVNGRNYLPWDDRLEMDVQYVEKISLFRDIKIIFQTFFQVLRAKNVVVVQGSICVLLSTYRQQLKEKKT
jgi:lipopolysaccharide/colanic/teichoic acid biosynthesis glycosyltransferase